MNIKPATILSQREYEAALRVEKSIQGGRILHAWNQLDHEETTVGKYHEAVDRGIRFAVIGTKRENRVTTARAAALIFVARVGSTRAIGAIARRSA